MMEGTLHMIDNHKPQEMYVILFDDMLLITRRKKGLSKKVRKKGLSKKVRKKGLSKKVRKKGLAKR